jgi:hypothetical protein
VETEKVKGYIATLKKDPDSPDANSAVGRFLCLMKQDWDAGIALLLKGPDGPLKRAAQKDSKASTGDEEDKVAASDSWYDLATTADPPGQLAMQSRAHFWYSTALKRVKGFGRATAESRLPELQQIIDARGTITKLCAANRLAMIEGQIRKWEYIGSGKSWQDFEHIAGDGGILVGFYYSTKGNEEPLEAMQPIFLSPRGETKAMLCGAWNNPISRRVTKAKNWLCNWGDPGLGRSKGSAAVPQANLHEDIGQRPRSEQAVWGTADG